MLTVFFTYSSSKPTSLEVLEYIGCCSALLASKNRVTDSLRAWFSKVPVVNMREAFTRMFEADDAVVRAGGARLVRALNAKALAPLMKEVLGREKDREVKRSLLATLAAFESDLSAKLATRLDADPDWIVRIQAKQRASRPFALFLSDGTAFAGDLMRMVENAGLRTVCPPILHPIMLTAEMSEVNILRGAELVVVVTGENYAGAGTEEIHAALCEYVLAGGRLLATCWVSWENKVHGRLDEVLPFVHVGDSYNEDVVITCRSTSHPLAEKLCPTPITLRTSFEVLRKTDRSHVLFEDSAGVPIFGFREVGLGVCYYLNSCQHSCRGPMPSPTRTSVEFADTLQRVMQWIVSGGQILRT